MAPFLFFSATITSRRHSSILGSRAGVMDFSTATYQSYGKKKQNLLYKKKMFNVQKLYTLFTTNDLNNLKTIQKPCISSCCQRTVAKVCCLLRGSFTSSDL